MIFGVEKPMALVSAINQLRQKQNEKRSDPNGKTECKFQGSDLKRLEKFLANATHEYPGFEKYLPYVDEWAEKLHKNKKIGSCMLRKFLKRGRVMNFYKTLPNSERQWCVSRIQLACIWESFVSNANDIIQAQLGYCDESLLPSFSGTASVLAPQKFVLPLLSKVEEKQEMEYAEVIEPDQIPDEDLFDGNYLENNENNNDYLVDQCYDNDFQIFYDL